MRASRSGVFKKKTKPTIRSIEEFVRHVRDDRSGWSYAWFRGEPADCDTPLIPKLYRPRNDGREHNENKLLQFFRMKAPTFSSIPCPDRGATDQWLYLAQHVGLPTRLLDWTESALVALHFALQHDKAMVWMLDPIALNRLSMTSGQESPESDEFPLPWFHPKEPGIKNIGSASIGAAWGRGHGGIELPVAIHPTNIHPRMSVQRSCFTVHGNDRRSLADQAPQLLRCYRIGPTARSRKQMREDLRILGISHSTVFPHLDWLAKELAEFY